MLRAGSESHMSEWDKLVGLTPSIRREEPRWSYREEAVLRKGQHGLFLFINVCLKKVDKACIGF